MPTTTRKRRAGVAEHLRPAVLGILALLVGGCASLETRSRVVILEHSANAYVTAIRWGDFPTASGFLRLREGTAPPLEPDRLEGVRVTAHSYQLQTTTAEST